MNDLQLLIIILCVTVAAAAMIGIALPWLRRHGIDARAALDKAKQALDAASRAEGLLRPFLPDSAGLAAFDRIRGAAATAVASAEQLCAAGALPPDGRKGAARQYVVDTLKLLGVDITPEALAVIDGAIESEVFALGHGDKPGKGSPGGDLGGLRPG
ncbi:MAG: hypothetical protein LBH28_03890 [Oscillospiraceae bacterium]|jgi:hypothetical protein|nr:hypothetical protein [Oscillospiraceae bacterium]